MSALLVNNFIGWRLPSAIFLRFMCVVSSMKTSREAVSLGREYQKAAFYAPVV